METSNDMVAAAVRSSAWIVARRWPLVVLCLAVIRTPLASSESDVVSEPGAGSATKSVPTVDLGRLLKLPDSYQQPTENRRGMGQSKWESRFELVRLDLDTAQTALDTAQQELGEVAEDSSQWSVAAPGTTPNPENTPLSYKLRQEIRRQREEVERAERKLLSLEIEADLAEVPDEWRAQAVGRASRPSTHSQDGEEPVTP